MASRMGFQILHRRLATTVAGPSAQSGQKGSVKYWQKLSCFLALPGVLLCYLNSKVAEHEANHGYVTPEFKDYSYMYRRNKKFPWGDGNHTLFHDKHRNALPEGYES